LNQETSPLSIPEYSKSWEELDETEKAKEIIRMQVYAAMIDRLDQCKFQLKSVQVFQFKSAQFSQS